MPVSRKSLFSSAGIVKIFYGLFIPHNRCLTIMMMARTGPAIPRIQNDLSHSIKICIPKPATGSPDPNPDDTGLI